MGGATSGGATQPGAHHGAWREKLMPLADFVDTFLMASEPGTEGHAAAGKATAEAAGEAAEDAQARHPHAVSSARAVVGYLAQHNLFEQIPRLRRDFAIPALLAGGVQHMHAWLGPEGTVTPLHFDSYDNVLVQVVGHKLVSLFDSGQTPRLYPKEGGGTGVDAQGNVSAVDVEAPDMGRFPEFAHAVGYECVLGPGEGLYIPAGCWHHVRSLSPSWSISFWF